ncbi:hypothetical protein C8J56DRAFT_1056893 [Mycena floridula]|nr:hypothetical protein C8J56DRAFT_1056893 [Mycena floridula]
MALMVHSSDLQEPKQAFISKLNQATIDHDSKCRFSLFNVRHKRPAIWVGLSIIFLARSPYLASSNPMSLMLQNPKFHDPQMPGSSSAPNGAPTSRVLHSPMVRQSLSAGCGRKRDGYDRMEEQAKQEHQRQYPDWGYKPDHKKKVERSLMRRPLENPHHQAPSLYTRSRPRSTTRIVSPSAHPYHSSPPPGSLSARSVPSNVTSFSRNPYLRSPQVAGTTGRSQESHSERLSTGSQRSTKGSVRVNNFTFAEQSKFSVSEPSSADNFDIVTMRKHEKEMRNAPGVGWVSPMESDEQFAWTGQEFNYYESETVPNPVVRW